MAFSATLAVVGGTAQITMAGELDAASAPVFRQEVERAAVHNPERLVLLMHDLEFMASAGLRALIFTRQKMGADVEIYLVGAQEMVLETVQMTGFHHSVVILDQYDPQEIEDGHL
jgi:anti-sigma B factor antagonist